ILFGLFTPTEASAVAVIYTVIIGAVVYRTLGTSRFLAAAAGAVKTAAMIMLIIGCAAMFGWLLALLEVPGQLASGLSGLPAHPVVIFLLINLLLLLLGTFMDMAPLIIITTPIFLPVVMALGMDPVQFGIIMMLNLGIGLLTPPVGSVLFLGSALGKVPVEETIRAIWPFYLCLIAVLMLITFFPPLTLWLPGAFR
ncbi:TRAP transporter large permease subunit, partial [Hyphomonas sp.]|uniref:TRAP transporter large permease subunit n=1 Tax=Hyphomonas sp. TaxID=87 RepID=UPI00391A7575